MCIRDSRRTAVFHTISINQLPELFSVQLIGQGDSLCTETVKSAAGFCVDNIQGIVCNKRISVPIIIDAAVTADQKFSLAQRISHLISSDYIVKIDFFYAGFYTGVRCV